MDTIKKIKCPACSRELTKVRVGKVTVDACIDGCGGIWFDQFELDEVNEPREIAGDKLMRIRRKSGIVVDKNAKHICPVCNVEMFNYNVTLGIPFVTDECPECGGFWLDGGEFDMLRNNSGIADTNFFDPVAAQSKCRKAERPLLTKLYDLLTFTPS